MANPATTDRCPSPGPAAVDEGGPGFGRSTSARAVDVPPAVGDLLIAGAARALSEHGYRELSVERIIEAAGVSHAAFYASFDTKGDCLLAAHRDIFERLLARLLGACAGERQWPLKVKAAVAALFGFAKEASDEVRLLTLDALATDPMIAGQAVDSNARLAALLREGRHHTTSPALPGLTEEVLVGAAAAILGGCLRDGRVDDLEKIESQLLQIVLTPYIGAEEGARVASAAGEG